MDKFNIKCSYHTNHDVEYKIYAQNKDDALKIAALKFDEDHRDSCKLDFISEVKHD